MINARIRFMLWALFGLIEQGLNQVPIPNNCSSFGKTSWHDCAN
jgi:hypothetical protein